VGCCLGSSGRGGGDEEAGVGMGVGAGGGGGVFLNDFLSICGFLNILPRVPSYTM
jgi:hypothetical protein